MRNLLLPAIWAINPISLEYCSDERPSEGSLISTQNFSKNDHWITSTKVPALLVDWMAC